MSRGVRERVQDGIAAALGSRQQVDRRREPYISVNNATTNAVNTPTERHSRRRIGAKKVTVMRTKIAALTQRSTRSRNLRGYRHHARATDQHNPCLTDRSSNSEANVRAAVVLAPKPHIDSRVAPGARSRPADRADKMPAPFVVGEQFRHFVVAPAPVLSSRFSNVRRFETLRTIHLASFLRDAARTAQERRKRAGRAPAAGGGIHGTEAEEAARAAIPRTALGGGGSACACRGQRRGGVVDASRAARG